MRERTITFPKDERVKGYVDEVLLNAGKKGVWQEGDRGFILKTDLSEEELKTLVADVLIWFFKTKTLCEGIKRGDMDQIAYCALIGALVGIEREREKETIKEIVPNSACVNVCGVYDFTLEQTRKEWYNLTKLGEKLYGQCAESKDVYSLCIFLLGANEEKENTLLIDPNGDFYSGQGDKEKIISYFSDEESDFIFSLLARTPSDVVVTDPRRLSERVLNVIRGLGEQ